MIPSCKKFRIEKITGCDVLDVHMVLEIATLIVDGFHPKAKDRDDRISDKINIIYRNQRKNRVFYIALVNEKIVGFINVKIANRLVEASDLVVADGYKRSGIARAFFEIMTRDFSSLDWIVIESYRKNLPVYTRLSFFIESLYPEEKSGETVYRMKRRIK